MDLFVVPTIAFDLLYVVVIVRLVRRDLVWINVTGSPTAEWIARQITEAFSWNGAPRYLIRDRDQVSTADAYFDLGSAEGERKSLYARTEKLDLELSICDGLCLSYQLVQPLFGHCTVALLVNVDSMRRTWLLSIDHHAKSY